MKSLSILLSILAFAISSFSSAAVLTTDGVWKTLPGPDAQPNLHLGKSLTFKGKEYTYTVDYFESDKDPSPVLEQVSSGTFVQSPSPFGNGLLNTDFTIAHSTIKFLKASPLAKRWNITSCLAPGKTLDLTQSACGQFTVAKVGSKLYNVILPLNLNSFLMGVSPTAPVRPELRTPFLGVRPFSKVVR